VVVQGVHVRALCREHDARARQSVHHACMTRLGAGTRAGSADGPAAGAVCSAKYMPHSQPSAGGRPWLEGTCVLCAGGHNPLGEGSGKTPARAQAPPPSPHLHPVRHYHDQVHRQKVLLELLEVRWAGRGNGTGRGRGWGRPRAHVGGWGQPLAGCHLPPPTTGPTQPGLAQGAEGSGP